jgi:hypothetical protein
LFFFCFSLECLTGDIFVARAAIPDWPIVSAKVSQAAVIAGVPPEVAPPSFAARRIRRGIPYHCRASYEFPSRRDAVRRLVRNASPDRASAAALAEAMTGQTVVVRYDPRKPKDSAVEGMSVLGRKVLQKDSNILNPKVF